MSILCLSKETNFVMFLAAALLFVFQSQFQTVLSSTDNEPEEPPPPAAGAGENEQQETNPPQQPEHQIVAETSKPDHNSTWCQKNRRFV